jgi:hypothetical protein
VAAMVEFWGRGNDYFSKVKAADKTKILAKIQRHNET